MVDVAGVKNIFERCHPLAKFVAGGANVGKGRGLWGLNRGVRDVRAHEGFKRAAAGSSLRKRRMLLKTLCRARRIRAA
jgi:hypothetical protein